MLSVNNLSKTYPDGTVGIDRVSITAPPGVFGLLGPNGAGKSTFMRILATLLEPDGGTAYLDDLDLIHDKQAARGAIGYLPQDFGLYPQLSAREMLDHLAVLKGIGPRRHRRRLVHQTLELTNLDNDGKRPLGTFSGGMRQRFGIAQAVIGSPRLLIVDEPTAGLDPTERNRFHNLLVRLSEKMVVILSTHIVEDIEDLCPNMAIMHGGRVRVSDTPRALKAHLAGRVWSKQMPQAEADRAAHELKVISTRLVEGTSEIHVLSDTAPGPDFEQRSPDLEDVYFAELSQGSPDTRAPVTA